MNELKNFYHGKQVLVTGGAGFIGSHICEKLLELGAKVRILDNLSTGSLANIAHLDTNIDILNGTITDLTTCINAAKNVEMIFHLAAFVSVPKSTQDPFACYQTNVQGTVNMLEAARRNTVPYFIFSSSSSVYGDQNIPCTEAMACNPQSPYGTSKLIGEKLCQDYAYSFGLKTICLRYFNVYGERQDPNAAYAAVVAKFKNLMTAGKPITIFGDGKQTRDFVSVEQVTMANICSPLADAHYLTGQPINIASGKSINLFELIELLKKDYPTWPHQIQWAPARPGDVTNAAADISRYRNTLLPKSLYHA
ncbi:MAG: SDR family NAD(P)-dependent oxidoreductase [Candidatus Babeliales bacterium]